MGGERRRALDVGFERSRCLVERGERRRLEAAKPELLDVDDGVWTERGVSDPSALVRDRRKERAGQGAGAQNAPPYATSNTTFPPSGQPFHRSSSAPTAVAKLGTLRKLTARSAPSYRMAPDKGQSRVGTDTRTRPQGACRLTVVVCVCGSCWMVDRRGKTLVERRASLRVSQGRHAGRRRTRSARRACRSGSVRARARRVRALRRGTMPS